MIRIPVVLCPQRFSCTVCFAKSFPFVWLPAALRQAGVASRYQAVQRALTPSGVPSNGWHMLFPHFFVYPTPRTTAFSKEEYISDTK